MEEDVRRKWVVVRFNEKEFEQLKRFQKSSTERSRSNYIRKMVLHQPITLRYRNDSADQFVEEMIGLKRELNAIGNNFNQAVHKLHTLDRIPEFRQWINHYQTAHQQFMGKVDQILERSNQIYRLWLQE